MTAAYDALAIAYATPPRAYHNLAHITACLSEFDTIRGEAADPVAVEFAIWFHDAVYDSKASDNEARSAQLAVQTLACMGIAGQTPHTAAELVLLTRHDRIPPTLDGQVVIDVDLAILGQPSEVYDTYEAAVRREYSWVTDREFRTGRARFIETMLARPRIFFTDACHGKYETRARANLQHALTRITALAASA